MSSQIPAATPHALITRRRSRALIVVIAALAIWVAATEPWGIAVYQLLVFMAPGALLGLGAGWMAYGSAQAAWTWRTARTAALLGAILLPPVLAFLVALDGNARPHRLLAGFIRAAWLAFAGGLAIAAARAIRDRSEKR